MTIELAFRWDLMAHRTGCPIATDGKFLPMSSGRIGHIAESHETEKTDSYFLTNHKRDMVELLQDADVRTDVC